MPENLGCCFLDAVHAIFHTVLQSDKAQNYKTECANGNSSKSWLLFRQRVYSIRSYLATTTFVTAPFPACTK